MPLLRGMARTAVIAGTATSVSNRVSRRQAQRWGDQDQAAQAAQQAGMPAEHIYHFPVDPQHTTEVETRKQEIMAFLQQHVDAQDLVLVKGSRGMRMETICALF